MHMTRLSRTDAAHGVHARPPQCKLIAPACMFIMLAASLPVAAKAFAPCVEIPARLNPSNNIPFPAKTRISAARRFGVGILSPAKHVRFPGKVLQFAQSVAGDSGVKENATASNGQRKASPNGKEFDQNDDATVQPVVTGMVKFVASSEKVRVYTCVWRYVLCMAVSI